jgi:hypothetical protein
LDLRPPTDREVLNGGSKNGAEYPPTGTLTTGTLWVKGLPVSERTQHQRRPFVIDISNYDRPSSEASLNVSFVDDCFPYSASSSTCHIALAAATTASTPSVGELFGGKFLIVTFVVVFLPFLVLFVLDHPTNLSQWRQSSLSF